MGLIQKIKGGIVSYLGYAPFTKAEVQKLGKYKALAMNPSNMQFQTGTNPGLKKPGKVSFKMLRNIAKADALIRICVNTIKKSISQSDWYINVKKEAPKEREYYKDKIMKVYELFEFMNNNGENVRIMLDRVLEDLLVLDAGVIEKVRTIDGTTLGALNSVDGATIRPIYDELGELGDPAYVQYVDEKVGAEFKQDEIVYMMSNPQNDIDFFGYGMSPIESILVQVQASMEADMYNIKSFTKDNIPPGMVDLGNITNEEAEEFIAMRNATVIGNTQALKFIRGSTEGKKYVPFNSSNKDMQYNEYIDWLSRVKLATFGLSGIDANIFQDVNRGCYDSDTETLTELGRKKYIDIGHGEKIATYNPETKKIEYHLPFGRYTYDVDEEIYYISNSNVDIAVTGEHKMRVKEYRGGEYKKMAMKDISWKTFRFLDAAVPSGEGGHVDNFILPGVEKSSHKSTGCEDLVLNMDDWLEFLGYFISEGGLAIKDIKSNSRYRLTLAQNIGVHKDKGDVAGGMASVLDRLGFSYDKHEDKNGCMKFNVYGKQLCMRLLNNCGGYCHEKKIPEEIKILPAKQLGILFKALMDGDGSYDTRKGRKSGYYATTSICLADDFQELAIKLGYRAKKVVKREETNTHNTLYNVLLCERKNGYKVTQEDIVKKHYKGVTYCFEVPNHLFVTRRNGKVTIQGNTAEVQYQIAQSRGVKSSKKLVEEYFTRQLVRDMVKDDEDYKWLEFKFVDAESFMDKKMQAEVDKIYVETGIITPNEIRIREGLKSVEMEYEEPGEPKKKPEEEKNFKTNLYPSIAKGK